MLRGGNDGPESKHNHPDEAHVRLLPRSVDKQYPLVLLLIVRLVRQRGLAGRDHSLDPHALSREQRREEFLVCLSETAVEKIYRIRDLDQFRHFLDGILIDA